jgi:hypothetical protein
MGMFHKKVSNPFEDVVRAEVVKYLDGNFGPRDVDRYTWIDADQLKAGCPSLKPMFDAIELNEKYHYFENIVAAGIVTLRPGGRILPHIDTTAPMLNFNIPLYGTGGSKTRFFKGKLVQSEFSPGTNVRGIVGTELEMLEEYTLDQTTWHLAKVLHDAVNGSTFRAIISFKFKQDPLELFFK